MAFTDQQYLHILRHLQTRVREFEPDVFELLQESETAALSPRDRLLRYLTNLINAMKERSKGSYWHTLGLLNEYIKTEKDNHIDAIEIALSSQDQEVYGLKLIDLSEIGDREGLLEDLTNILREIEREG